jgi:protein-disulfide isomerase/uncharacterized membrane protein
VAKSAKRGSHKARRQKATTDPRLGVQRFFVLGLLTLAGLGVSIYLVVAHYSRLADASAVSACNFGGWLDCDTVNTSRYSEFLGVSVACFGVAFYLLFAGLSLHAALVEKRRFAATAYLRFLSLAALAETIFLAFISLFVLRAFCLFCVGLYAINITLLIVSWRTPSGGIGFFKVVDKDLRMLTRRPVAAVIVSAIAIMIVAGFIYAYKLGIELRDVNRLVLGERIMVAGNSIGAVPGQVMGFHDSKVTLFLFSDFECHYCKTANQVFNHLIERFGDRVRFVYKHFPLNVSCNPSIKSTRHKNACRAARAAVCAAEKGKFDVFHRAVFTTGAGPKGLSRAAEEAGLDKTELIRCIESLRAEELVSEDVKDGITLGVKSTPSFFIDDILLTGARNEKTLTGLIEKKLSSH